MIESLRQLLYELSRLMDTASYQLLVQSFHDAVTINWLDITALIISVVGVGIAGFTLVVLKRTLAKVAEYTKDTNTLTKKAQDQIDESKAQTDEMIEQTRASKAQTDEMIKQRNLSISPALTFSVKALDLILVKCRVANMGNGTAVNIRINPIELPDDDGGMWRYSFPSIVYLRVGEGKNLCPITCERRDLKCSEWKTVSTDMHPNIHLKALLNGTYRVMLRFDDILGNHLKQELSFAKQGVNRFANYGIVESAQHDPLSILYSDGALALTTPDLDEEDNSD